MVCPLWVKQFFSASHAHIFLILPVVFSCPGSQSFLFHIESYKISSWKWSKWFYYILSVRMGCYRLYRALYHHISPNYFTTFMTYSCFILVLVTFYPCEKLAGTNNLKNKRSILLERFQTWLSKPIKFSHVKSLKHNIRVTWRNDIHIKTDRKTKENRKVHKKQTPLKEIPSVT